MAKAEKFSVVGKRVQRFEGFDKVTGTSQFVADIQLPGELIGKVYFADSDKGLVIKPRLKGLSAGDHGFHVHANRSCKPAKSPEGKMVPGLGAGGHYDPDKSGKHEGPTGKGHLGDLPALKVGADGTVKGTLMAPRLKVADLKKHSLMIHAGGDNYSDQPAALGGGGARFACGVIGKGKN